MGSGGSHSSLYLLQCVPFDPVSLYLPGLLDSDIYQMEKDIAIEQERNARYRPPKILEPTAFQEPPPKVSQAWASLVLQPQQNQVPLWPNCPFLAQGAGFFTLLFQLWTQPPTIYRCPSKRNLGTAHSPWGSQIKSCPLEFPVEACVLLGMADQEPVITRKGKALSS